MAPFHEQVMGKVGFNYPVALSLIHYAVAWLLMAILRAFSLLPVAPPSKSTPFSSLFVLGAVMSLSTGLANVSLQHNRSNLILLYLKEPPTLSRDCMNPVFPVSSKNAQLLLMELQNVAALFGF